MGIVAFSLAVKREDGKLDQSLETSTALTNLLRRRFSGDESFLDNPNGYNDVANSSSASSGFAEGEGSEEGEKSKGSRSRSRL